MLAYLLAEFVAQRL